MSCGRRAAMTERLRCPACGKLLVVELASPHERVVCPACGGAIAVSQSAATLQPTSAAIGSTPEQRPVPWNRDVRQAARSARFPVAATISAAGIAILLIGGLVATVLHRRGLASSVPVPPPIAA